MGIVIAGTAAVLTQIRNYILNYLEKFLLNLIFKKLLKLKIVNRVIKALKVKTRRYPVRQRRRPDFYGEIISH